MWWNGSDCGMRTARWIPVFFSAAGINRPHDDCIPTIITICMAFVDMRRMCLAKWKGSIFMSLFIRRCYLPLLRPFKHIINYYLLYSVRRFGIGWSFGRKIEWKCAGGMRFRLENSADWKLLGLCQKIDRWIVLDRMRTDSRQTWKDDKVKCFSFIKKSVNHAKCNSEWGSWERLWETCDTFTTCSDGKYSSSLF